MFSTMLDYYSRYARVSDRTRALGERVQADLVNRSRAVALASDWAAAGAAASFPCAAARLHVVPMGANLDDPPPPAPPRGASGPLRLLFVGYDWQRKGGAIILPVFEALRRRLPDTELHIVGGAAPATRGVAGIVHHGILRKAVPAEAATLAGLFEHSNLFFMPSREEAFGLVYCEACAYGLPSIATRTGGVPTYVDERRHGMLFDPDAPVEDYVEGIVALWSDAPRYAAMQVAARLDYETRLNWQSWAAAIETLALAVA
jgi:glycosyltransferase involved in cell wall biosynthesis